MVINISPNRINIQSGNSRNSTGKRYDFPADGERIIIPSRADVNNIPSAESLNTMIRSAVAAIGKGVYWDRGTILNLIV